MLEPLDGELFTGPASYIRMDIARINKLMCLGVFTKERRANMLRIMGGIMAKKDVPETRRAKGWFKRGFPVADPDKTQVVQIPAIAAHCIRSAVLIASTSRRAR